MIIISHPIHKIVGTLFGDNKYFSYPNSYCFMFFAAIYNLWNEYTMDSGYKTIE